MSTQLIHSLRAEIAALESDLDQDPRYQAICRLRDLLAFYEGVMAGRSSGRVAAPTTKPARPQSEMRQRALNLSVEYVAGRIDPTPTRELHDMLMSKGVEVGGKEPISNLSAILSRSGKLRPMGRAGWLPLDEGAPGNDGDAVPDDSNAQSQDGNDSAQNEDGEQGFAPPTAFSADHAA